MESWKQSGLAAVVVIIAILAGAGLQRWSLEHGPAAPAGTASVGEVPTPTPADTVTPSPTPTAFDWSHRFAVYTGQVRIERDATDRSIPVRSLVTWDVTEGKLAASFEYGGSGAYPVGVALAGHNVVFATEHQVVEAALDGTERRQVFAAGDGNIIQDIAVSPDGSSLAIVVSPEDIAQPGVLRILDLQTLQERLVARQSDPRFAPMWGHFGQAQWRGDGAGVLVGTLTHTEMWGSLVTIFLDGRVRIEDVQGYGNVSPSGRMRAGDIGESGCMFIGTHNFVIRNLDSGETPLSINNPSVVITPWEWSPDGTQFVFLQQPAAGCDQISPDRAVIYVIKPSGPGTFGAPTVVSDVAALHRDWYGNNLFTADCDHGNDPVVGRSGELRPLCYLEAGPGPYRAVTVRVGGQAIGTAVNPVSVGVIAP